MIVNLLWFDLKTTTKWGKKIFTRVRSSTKKIKQSELPKVSEGHGVCLKQLKSDLNTMGEDVEKLEISILL